MKNIALTIIIIMASITNGFGQATESTPKVQFSKIINKSASEFWQTVRELDQIDRYSSNIARVEWIGPRWQGGVRICYSPGDQGYFKEQIDSFDDEKMKFIYSLTEGAPVSGMTNTMQVVDLGNNKCVFIWWSNYDQFIENPQMTEEQFQQFMLSSLEEMTSKMEVGS